MMTAGTRRPLTFGAGGRGRKVAWLADEALPAPEFLFVIDDERYVMGPVNRIPVEPIEAVAPSEHDAYVTAVGYAALRRRFARFLETRGVHIAGRVDVGVDASIGIGASVANGSHDRPRKIGGGAADGAGAVVLSNVSSNARACGLSPRALHIGTPS